MSISWSENIQVCEEKIKENNNEIKQSKFLETEPWVIQGHYWPVIKNRVNFLKRENRLLKGLVKEYNIEKTKEFLELQELLLKDIRGLKDGDKNLK